MPEKKSQRPNNIGPHKAGSPASPTKRSAGLDDVWQDLPMPPAGSPGLPGPTGKPKSGSWFKKNPNAVKAIVAGGLLVVLLLILVWQFGGSGASSPQTPVVPNSSTQTTARSTPTAKVSASTQHVAKSTPPHKLGEASNATEPDSDETPKAAQAKKEADRPAPDDISTWKKEDYFRARRQNDPRLLLAITRLAEKAHGSAVAAAGLTELLKPLPEDVLKRSTDASMHPDRAPRAPGKYDAPRRSTMRRPRSTMRPRRNTMRPRRNMTRPQGSTMRPPASTTSLTAEVTNRCRLMCRPVHRAKPILRDLLRLLSRRSVRLTPM